MQPTNIAIALRRRTPWEAIDLGLSMLQHWWRAVFAPHLVVGGAAAALALLAAWWLERPWLAILLIWWMKPLYDRVVLQVLSRAVFGEVLPARAVLGAWREWLSTGLFAALLLRWVPDLARSFSLPVRQLEGQSGAAGRERRGILGRRARGYAVWLTLACMHFEAILYIMLGGLADLALPAKATEGRAGESLMQLLASGDFWTYGGAVGYAVAVLLLEPFYVAAGFGLYLNRRTLLEGWDIEVALRRIAERHAAVLLLCLSCVLLFPMDSHAQAKNPREEIKEVLKAKEFGYERDAMRWQSRNPEKPREKSDDDGKALWGIGYALARAAEVLLWGVAIAAALYALWFLARMLPRGREPAPEPYRPPPALFGMDLAPETLPPDVAAAAAALAREGKLRDALSLLYRGALSNLVHRRGVQLLPSHTEAEVLSLSGQETHAYLENLIGAWRLCAYGRREPAAADIERLARDYQASFA